MSIFAIKPIGFHTVFFRKFHKFGPVLIFYLITTSGQISRSGSNIEIDISIHYLSQPKMFALCVQLGQFSLPVYFPPE